MSKKKATAISLPLSRTAKIMNSAVGVESVNQDIVALATKATEIFLMDFAHRAYDQSSSQDIRSNVLEYDDIHKLVHSDPRYDFLEDSIPKKIKFTEALKLVEAANIRKAEAEVEAKRRRIEIEEEKARIRQEKERDRLRKESLEQQQQQQEAEVRNLETENNSNQTNEQEQQSEEHDYEEQTDFQ